MTALPGFKSPKTVLARGRTHIEDLRARIADYADKAQIDQVTTFEIWTKEYVVKMVFREDIPDDLSAIAKDALSNLRDALDQAVYASAVAVNGGAPKRTKFLVGPTKDDIENDLRRKRYSDVPQDIIDLMWTFQPYEGGNPLLLPLNLVRNDSTHKYLVPILHKLGSTSLTLSAVPTGGFHLVSMGGPEEWNEDRRELVLARLGTPPTAELELSAKLDVVLGGSDTLRKESATSFLDAAASEVERIIMAIEAETVRILNERMV